MILDCRVDHIDEGRAVVDVDVDESMMIIYYSLDHYLAVWKMSRADQRARRF